MHRLLEAAAWAVARWAHTYLMPEEAVSREMHDAFGAGTAGGAETAELLVKVAGVWSPPILHACVAQVRLFT